MPTFRLMPSALPAVTLALALSGAPAIARAQGPAAAVARIDSLVAAGQVALADAAAEAALRGAPGDFELLWRRSRLHVLRGDALPTGSKEQGKAYRDALAVSERAIKAAPQAPDGYVRRAAAAGKVALFSGVLEAADWVLMAKADAERVLAMPNVPPATRATAAYILGRTHLKLTETPRPLRMPLGLAFGNLPDALRHLEEATRLRPRFVMFELDYARALVADGQGPAARTRLTAVAGLAEQEPGDAARKAEAAALLRTVR